MKENVKEAVVKRYSDRISTKSGGSCDSSCCSPGTGISKNTEAVTGSCCGDTSHSAEGSTGRIESQSFGCGNPVGLSSVREGDIVVDLGSGAGLDCIRAAAKVGAAGKVVGVDMSEEMISRANQNIKTMGLENTITLVKGDIEDIPLHDNYATLVISNCVLALAPDKQKVFNEVYRILKPHGRFVISDVVSADTIPQELRDDIELFSSCVSGASQVDEYFQIIKNAGFTNIEELARQNYGSLDTREKSIEMYSLTIRGYK
ncbi:MAG: type 11 methyltransferase [Ferroplasma sp. Type II]|jgi:ubiquinone/menaquinone biosynthesis C-methylase UbiE|uniref:methyltransferase domain-containing protein n=1 Tax=Ferroplasma sp. Type II TaxID=261388 RepID=UPI000389493A|nr:methyltransferase domain-containing protein [Ferroplasma sp. Type II]EQB70666.1 MAG: type 11 methyltransferase [Ferroplasma sp. Type II]